MKIFSIPTQISILILGSQLGMKLKLGGEWAVFAYWKRTRFFVMEVLGHVQLKVGRVGGKDAVGKPLSPCRLRGGRRPRHSHCAVDRCNLGHETLRQKDPR